MALTLADHSLQFEEPYQQAVVKIFEERSPILRFLTYKRIQGDVLKYRIETGMPGIQNRRVNEDYLESTGVLEGRVEPLYITGGELFIDTFITKTSAQGPGALDHKKTQWEMKSRALSREISRLFFEGDDLVDPDEMPGLRRRLTGSQVLLAGTNGASLTVAMIDELIDTVIPGNVAIFAPKVLRRKLTSLLLAGGASATYQVNYGDIDKMGKQVMTYNGVPIHIVEDLGNQASMLGFDETAGTSAITASIYCVNFDENAVFGIFGGDGPPVSCYSLGEDQDSPGEKARIEFFHGLVIKHPRGAARLRGLLAA